MRPVVRNVLVLAGCLAVVAVAGAFAMVALRSATVAPTQVASAPVVVDSDDAAGAAKLTVLAAVTFDSGGGQRQVAAGTQFITTGALLGSAMSGHRPAAVGATLDCDLRISVSGGQPVIDLVRCAPARTSPRG